MDRDEWYTEDGINYQAKTFDEPDIVFSFSQEGMKLLSGKTQEEIGEISWRELASSGGDTYNPSNMRISTATDNNINFGFNTSNGQEITGLTLTYVNGKPEVIISDLVFNTMRGSVIQLQGPDGAYRGTSITADTQGDMMFTFRANGTNWTTRLSDIFNL